MSGRDDTTRDRVLEAARRLVQSRGFSGFSFADVAAHVGIRKASVHHHFPTKDDLGFALMARYRSEFGAELARIDASKGDANAKLRAYSTLFADVLRDGHRMCMCGMLAADFDALPASLRAEVCAFFDDNVAWLAALLAGGRKQGALDFVGSAREEARVVLSTMEGAMLVARSHGDVAVFEAVAQRVLGSVSHRPRRRASSRKVA